MNCPNCGRPVSPTANICPSCKTKIFHNKATDPNYNPDGTRKTIKVDEKKLKNRHANVKMIISIIFILAVIIIALHFIFLDKLIDFATEHEWGWYYWILTGEEFAAKKATGLLGMLSHIL